MQVLGKALDGAMTEIERNLPVGITIHRVANQPEVVDESVREFSRSLAEALAIVLVVSFLSLGFRTGIIVALSVPPVLMFLPLDRGEKRHASAKGSELAPVATSSCLTPLLRTSLAERHSGPVVARRVRRCEADRRDRQGGSPGHGRYRVELPRLGLTRSSP